VLLILRRTELTAADQNVSLQSGSEHPFTGPRRGTCQRALNPTAALSKLISAFIQPCGMQVGEAARSSSSIYTLTW